MRFRFRRRLNQLIVALYAVAILAAVALVAGPVLHDLKIAANPQRALGTVTGVDWRPPAAEYRARGGIHQQPASGLLYPTALAAGQQVWVTFSGDDPELVKVEGREWTLSIIPAISVAVVSSIVAGGAWWLVNYRRSRDVGEQDE